MSPGEARTIVDRAFCAGLITSIEAEKRCKRIEEVSSDLMMMEYWIADLLDSDEI